MLAADRRPSKAMSKAFNAAFQRMSPRQSLEPVTDQHEHVADPTVVDLTENTCPALRPLPVAVLACPQPEDVAFPADGDPMAR